MQVFEWFRAIEIGPGCGQARAWRDDRAVLAYTEYRSRPFVHQAQAAFRVTMARRESPGCWGPPYRQVEAFGAPDAGAACRLARERHPDLDVFYTNSVQVVVYADGVTAVIPDWFGAPPASPRQAGPPGKAAASVERIEDFRAIEFRAGEHRGQVWRGDCAAAYAGRRDRPLAHHAQVAFRATTAGEGRRDIELFEARDAGEAWRLVRQRCPAGMDPLRLACVQLFVYSDGVVAVVPGWRIDEPCAA